MTEQVEQLQTQVDGLIQNVNALRQEPWRLAPTQDRLLPQHSNATPSPPSSVSVPSLYRPDLPNIRQPPAFLGPTSIAFTVDVAKTTLKNMGYRDGQDDNGVVPEDVVEAAAPPQPSPRKPPLDPLWDFDKDEMIRLCRVHEDEVGIMYPVLKIESVISHAKFLASWMESVRKNGLVPPYGQDEGISDIKTLQLKVVMCCALAVEEHGNSEKGIRLFQSIEPVAYRKLMCDPSDFSNLPFLALVAGYRFLSNDEVLAWRIMGQVARHCLELGLHRREVVSKIEDHEDRQNAIITFWTAYVLDRRWSFATGLPYVVHDDNIDPMLPFPVSPRSAHLVLAWPAVLLT